MTISKDSLGKKNPVKYTATEEAEMVKMYKEGMNTVQIAKITGKMYNTSIRRVLLRHGVILRVTGEDQRLVKGNPLLNNHYWLGVLATDGNVYKNRVKVAVQKRDVDWIHSFANLTGANVLSEPKGCMAVGFNSPEIVQYLISLGITPNKSLTLNYKGLINWDFIRGVIDGDGTITNGCPIKLGIYSASLPFLEQLLQFFTEEGLRVRYPVIVNGRTYGLTINKTEDVLIAYSKLYYQNEVPCLLRKKGKFGSLIQEWISKQTAKSANILKNAELAGFRLDSISGQV